MVGPRQRVVALAAVLAALGVGCSSGSSASQSVASTASSTVVPRTTTTVGYPRLPDRALNAMLLRTTDVAPRAVRVPILDWPTPGTIIQSCHAIPRYGRAAVAESENTMFTTPAGERVSEGISRYADVASARAWMQELVGVMKCPPVPNSARDPVPVVVSQEVLRLPIDQPENAFATDEKNALLKQRGVFSSFQFVGRRGSLLVQLTVVSAPTRLLTPKDATQLVDAALARMPRADD